MFDSILFSCANVSASLTQGCSMNIPDKLTTFSVLNPFLFNPCFLRACDFMIEKTL